MSIVRESPLGAADEVRPGSTWQAREIRRLALRYLIALALTAFFLFPIYWLFMISFKTPEEIFASPPSWIAGSLQFANYAVLFKDGDAITVWNSLVVAGVSTVIAMLLGTIAAYSLARFKTGGDNLAIWIISQRMIPPIAIVFPIFLLYVWLGWVDSYIGLIVLYTAFNLPYVIWMMRGYIEDIPIELEESALVDGCTRLEVVRKVVFPMARAGLFATAVFTFVFAWNDFIFALVLTRREVTTFPVQVTHYFGGQSNFWAKIAAMSVLGTVPIFIAVAIMQRYLVRGISLGAVKGSRGGTRDGATEDHRPAQVLWPDPCRARRRPRHPRGRVRGAGGPVRLRQEHAFARDRGPRAGRPRHGRDRRRGGQRHAAARSRRRHGVPELRALPVHERVREHRLRPARAEISEGRDRQPGAAGRKDARHRGPARAPAAPALGRPAPARRDRPRDRARRPPVPVRRAALQPRRQAARRDAQRDQASAPGTRQDHGLRHPRPGRGDDARRPHRAAEGGCDRAGGSAAGPVRAAAHPLRRGLSGLPLDEFSARDPEGAWRRRGAGRPGRAVRRGRCCRSPRPAPTASRPGPGRRWSSACAPSTSPGRMGPRARASPLSTPRST